MADVETALRILNEALEAEPEAVSSIFRQHKTASRKLDAHPTIQVGEGSMSALGLLNGIFGARPDGWGHLTAVWEGDRVVRFENTSAYREADHG